MHWYTSKFPRGGPAADFIFEVLPVSPGVSLEVAVEHRDVADGPWTTLDYAVLTTSVHVHHLAGIMKEVRMGWSFRAGRSTDRFPVILHPPQWRTE